MLFSKSTEYAVRALTFLAMQPAGKLAGARAISEAQDIPMPFLWKILRMLARQRMIRSFRGKHGGYQLARAAEKIRISDVVFSTDGAQLKTDCVMGLQECGEAQACPLHEAWKAIRARMVAMLEQNTLADLARIARKRKKK